MGALYALSWNMWGASSAISKAFTVTSPLPTHKQMDECVCVCVREKERVGEREVGVKIDMWMDKYRMVNLRGRVYVLDKDK